jgi:hypothetical protein
MVRSCETAVRHWARVAGEKPGNGHTQFDHTLLWKAAVRATAQCACSVARTCGQAAEEDIPKLQTKVSADQARIGWLPRPADILPSRVTRRPQPKAAVAGRSPTAPNKGWSASGSRGPGELRPGTGELRPGPGGAQARALRISGQALGISDKGPGGLRPGPWGAQARVLGISGQGPGDLRPGSWEAQARALGVSGSGELRPGP